ncbi:hypothetical protein Tco_0443449 [Tanacetum coccineum]
MHQFWNTIKKIKDKFKLDKQKFQIDTEVFRKILQICPRLPNQDFVEPPSDEEMVLFIKDLGYTGKCDMLSKIHTDQIHQPWRTFAAVISRCISGKSTGLDRRRPSRAQILWEMFYKKNVDFVALLWEDFMFQADNRDISFARKENMLYPRFTKVIINHFISKDQTISIRNRINLHTIRDDSLREEHAKKPKRAKHPEPAQKSAPAKKDVSSKKPLRKQSTGVQIRDTPGVSVSKNKAPATTDRSKGINLLFEAALLEDAQMKKVSKRSKRETHSHQASGSGDGVGSQPKVPDELQDKTIGTDEGTGTKLGVPDVPKDQSESENESWGESGDDDDSNDDDVSDDDGNKDNSNDNGEEEYKDEYVRTPSSYESTYDENEHVHEEEYDHIDKELYKDVNMELKDVEHGEEGKCDAELTDVGHDNKTEVPLQSSSVSFDFATQFLNLDNVPPANTEINSMMNIDVRHEEPSNQTPSLLTKPVTVIHETSTATATTIPLPIPPFTPLLHQSTPTPTPTTKATTSLPAIPDFSYLCGFNQRVSILEKELFQIKQVDHSAQLLEAIKSQVPAVIEAHLGTRLRNTIQQILPKEVSDFATPVIQSTVTESLENVILAKSSSQPQSTYEAASSLTEF